MAEATKSFPLTLRGDLSVPPGQAWWLLKWLTGIPHYIVLAFLCFASCIATLIAFFAILFTGNYPKSLFTFNAGVLRWYWRVGFYSYQALGTDKYPPFSLEPDDSYPADLHIEYPTKPLSRGLVLVKWWLLAIPHYIVLALFQGGGGEHSRVGLTFILAIFAGVVLLFKGKYPNDIFKLVIGINRWSYRVFSYVMLMTDDYPPFRLEE